MLGFVSKYGSSRGMTTVPSIVGQSSSAGSSAITGKFLRVGSVGTTSTSNSSLDGVIASQGISAGSIVDPDTAINYVVYSYVNPAPYVVSYGACLASANYIWSCCGDVANGSHQVTFTSYSQQRSWSNGYIDFISCAETTTSYGTCAKNDGRCGYSAPTCSNAGTYSAAYTVGTCKVGTTSIQSCKDYTDANCVTTKKASCTTKACSCTAKTTYTPASGYYPCKNKEQWRDVTWVNSDCSTGTYSQVRKC